MKTKPKPYSIIEEGDLNAGFPYKRDQEMSLNYKVLGPFKLILKQNWTIISLEDVDVQTSISHPI